MVTIESKHQQENGMNIIESKRNGSSHEVLISGVSKSELKVAFPDNYSIWDRPEGALIVMNNKRERQALDEYINNHNAVSVSNTTKSSSSRYVELLAVAERDQLNHGKTWVADGYTVDKNSLHPSAEGQPVCYIY